MRTLMGPPVTIISAELSTLDSEENGQRTAALKVDLIKAFGSKSIKQVRGCYKGVKEVAFVVSGDRSKLIDLADIYNQESILALDTARNAALIFTDIMWADEPLGRFQAVPIEEALAAEAYTFDISQNTYYVVK